MEEVKFARVNGYLNLDKYFIEKLGREYMDEEDLFINGLIDVELDGLSDKFWIMSSDGNNRIALFKEQGFASHEAYAELFGEEIANVLGIPTAHYDLAIFNGKRGVISYDFFKGHDSYYSGFDVIADFYESKEDSDEYFNSMYGLSKDLISLGHVTDKLNNLEDIWSILEETYKNNPQKQQIVSKIVNGLVDKLIFDILTINTDDHSDNWAILDNKSLSPLYDNERILNMNRNISIEQFDKKESLEDASLKLTVDNDGPNKPLEVLEHFLKISSSEYRNVVIDKVNKLEQNIEVIPDKIEARTESKMPNYLKNYFINSMHDHIDKVNMVIHGNSKGTYK